MNIHHLELFYYVARHGGISEAVRNIPYGIQQPAVSHQILQLEEDLGTKLFNRRPFSSTPAGRKLYAFIQPFFSTVDDVGREIRGNARQFIRFGAPNTALRTHCLELLKTMRQKIPSLHFTLHDAIEPELLALLEREEIDLALTNLPSKLPAGLFAEPLLKLPLVLIVPENHPLKSAAELWKRDKIEEPLICLPPVESITGTFQEGLAVRHVDWLATILVNSIDLIEIYVANGFGIGVSVAIPGVKLHPGLRRLPLADFDPVSVGALWRGKPTPLIKAFVAEMKLRANAL